MEMMSMMDFYALSESCNFFLKYLSMPEIILNFPIWLANHSHVAGPAVSDADHQKFLCAEHR